MGFPRVTNLGVFTAAGPTPYVVTDGNATTYQVTLSGVTTKVDLDFEESLDAVNWWSDDDSKKVNLTNGTYGHKHTNSAVPFARVNIKSIDVGASVTVKVAQDD